ncbi:hypothetical protein AC578_6607 [Pseudocercospora eumusae]|uniref:Ankyrin n=1 Tax=Pseudocercospora eumusae TaxID=321146 RepID=A0A139GYB6_9PEZI|nr:hypothetical protein AC578_6607 [Pseudocercospora eumusae]
MDGLPAQQQSGHDFSGNQAGGHARQQNGDQIYNDVQTVHHGDAYYTSGSGPVFVPRSGYLSPRRWLDEPVNNAAMIEAATHGQLQRLAYLLKQPDKNVDFLDDFGMGPLHYAVRSSHVEAVKMLLNHGGANPGLQRPDRTAPTPLALAARGGHLELVRLLLKAGAPTDSAWIYPRPSKWERVSTLSEAIICGNHDVVAELVKCGAPLNEPLETTREYEINPLSLAMLVGEPELVELLLDLGAGLTWNLRLPAPTAEQIPSGSRLSFGHVSEGYLQISPLALAVLRQNGLRMLEYLLKRKPSSFLQHEAFRVAAMTANVDAMECLLRNGVSVNRSQVGKDALLLCSYFGVTAAVETLLKHGADPLSPASDFQREDSPTMRPEYRKLWRKTVTASVGPYFYPLPMLVQSYVYFAAWPSNSYAIHLAVGHPEVLKLFIASGVMVDLPTADSHCTPLHVAASWLEPVSAKYLLNCGASLHSKSRSGRTPFEMALDQHCLGSYEKSAKRELLDMLRTTSLTHQVLFNLFNERNKPLPDPMGDWQAPAPSLVKFSSTEQNEEKEKAKPSSWALSERYSANSWALSENYSVRSQHLSKGCGIEEIDEDVEANQELDLTAMTEDNAHHRDTEPVSSDDIIDSMKNLVVDLEPGGQQEHDLVGNAKPYTAANRRQSRWFG